MKMLSHTRAPVHIRCCAIRSGAKFHAKTLIFHWFLKVFGETIRSASCPEEEEKKDEEKKKGWSGVRKKEPA